MRPNPTAARRRLRPVRRRARAGGVPGAAERHRRDGRDDGADLRRLPQVHGRARQRLARRRRAACTLFYISAEDRVPPIECTRLIQAFQWKRVQRPCKFYVEGMRILYICNAL